MGIGPLHTIGLAEAREKARELRQQIKAGIDPLRKREEAKRERLAQKAEDARAITFRQCAEMFLSIHSKQWKNPVHIAQWTSTLETYAYPVIADLAVDDIDTSHLVKILEPLFQRIPETASRLRGRIERIIGYATAAKFRTGDNPARWRGHLRDCSATRRRRSCITPLCLSLTLPYSWPSFAPGNRSRPERWSS